MVVGFVLEQEQPILIMAIHINLYLDGAGVDFFGFIKILQNAVLLEPLRADGAHIHEAYRLFVAAKLVTHLKILIERGLHGRVIDLHIIKLCAERGVTAMIGPIRVDHLDFRDRRITLFLGEVSTAELQISQIHGQATIDDELLEIGVAHGAEAFDDLHLARYRHLRFQRGLGFQRSFARLDRVDHIMLDGGDIGVAQLAFKRIHFGGTNSRTLSLGDQLNAFAGGIRTLVELAGQILHSKHNIRTEIRQIGGNIIDLRLTEHGRGSLCEQFLANAFHVITIDETHILQRCDAKNGLQLVGELPGLDIKTLLLFHVHAKNHG